MTRMGLRQGWACDEPRPRQAGPVTRLGRRARLAPRRSRHARRYLVRLQGQRPPRPERPRPATRAGPQRHQLHRPPRRRRGRPAGVRAAPRRRPRHQEPHAGEPGFLPGGIRAQRPRRRGPRPLVRRRRRGAGGGAGDLPAGRRQDRDQGQVDDRRGTGHQRPPRTPRHHARRDRSRRVHHPAPPRTAKPHHRPRLPPEHGRLGGGVPKVPRRPARRPLPGRAPGHPDGGTNESCDRAS